MSVLGLLKKVKVQSLSFEKHPCRELDQEVMVHYLNGLALITNEDENVCEKEKEYLSILINSFGLSEDMLETFVNFAENPDEKLILDMMQSFATKDIKYNFIVDAMMIASIDGELHKNEKAIINEYFEMFKITKEEARDLKYIYKMFYTQNGNALFRYFGKQNKDDIFTIKSENFQYLLDYYKIDMVYELQEEEKKILSFEFFKPTFSTGSLGDGATEIMIKPINNTQFCIFLNSAFIDRTIEIDGNGKVVDSESKDLLMNLDNSEISFKDEQFIIDINEDENGKITGISCELVINFIDWINKKTSDSYQLSNFYGTSHNDRDFNISNFENKPFDEFIIRTSEGRDELIYTICKNNRGEGLFLRDYNRININSTDNITSFRMMKIPENGK